MEHPTLSVPLPKWRLTCGAGVGESYQRHHAKNPPNMCAFLEQIVSRPACVFCRISDPSMGGAYLTLLNTIANLGITLPKIFIFAAMDWMTVRQCRPLSPEVPLPPLAHEACRSGFTAASSGGGDNNACTAAGGECAVVSDGFYRLSALFVVSGLVLMLWLQRVLPQLQRLPLAAWRSKG